MIRDVDKKLKQMLDENAYKYIDAVNSYCTSCNSILRSIAPGLSAFDIWESLEIPIYIWARLGFDKSRIAVMERADCTKTSLVMRCDNHPAEAAYIDIYNGIAMVHAQEILPSQRHKGVGAIAIRHAAIWARAQNAPYISVIFGKENKAANALYTSLKLHPVGGYHYPIKEEST